MLSSLARHAAWLALATGCAPPPVERAAGVAERSVVADSARFDFRDDHEPDRIVAEVRVRLERSLRDEFELFIEAAAEGPLVHPIRGFRGVRGSNHQTAHELGELTSGEDDRLELAVRRRGREAARSGVVDASQGTLLERRLSEHGTVELVRSEALTTFAELSSGELDEGEWVAEVRARGEVRLRVRIELSAAGGVISSVSQLAPLQPLGEWP